MKQHLVFKSAVAKIHVHVINKREPRDVDVKLPCDPIYSPDSNYGRKCNNAPAASSSRKPVKVIVYNMLYDSLFLKYKPFMFEVNNYVNDLFWISCKVLLSL